MADDTKTSTIWEKTLVKQPVLGRESTRRRPASDDIEAFTLVAGDKNPLHYDKAFAERSVFRRPIVQSGVTQGILNACRRGPA